MPYPSPADEDDAGLGCAIIGLGLLIGAALACAIASCIFAW